MKTLCDSFAPFSKTFASLIFVYFIFINHSFAMPVAGDLIISEVLANPAAVSDTTGEWFEVFNNTENTIDLSGLLIRDDGSNQHVVSSKNAILIGAYDYFVFGRNNNTAVNGNYEADYIYSDFTLGNTSDEIILEFDGITIASLLYDDATLFGVSGNSAEFDGANFQLTNTDSLFGAGDIGTPGVMGSKALFAGINDSADGNVDEESSNSDSDVNVPEPATIWLMGLGLIGLITLRERAGNSIVPFQTQTT